MENEKTPINLLFGSIAVYKPEDVDLIIDNMTFEQSLFYIMQAIQYGHHSNLFSLQESELISKSLRILNKGIKSEE
jgi:hypothetical protein